MRRLRLHVRLFLLFLAIFGASFLWRPPAQLPILDAATLFRIRTITSDADVPADIRALDGRRVIVRGELYPRQYSQGTQGVVIDFGRLVNIGNPRPAQDRVLVNLRSLATRPSRRLFDDDVNVYGIFHVKIERDENTDAVISVFRMDVDQIVPYSPPDIPSPPMWVGASRWGGIAGASASLLIPLIGFLRATHVKRRLARRDLCRRCGYDLRATPDRCPECGTSQLERIPNQFGR